METKISHIYVHGVNSSNLDQVYNYVHLHTGNRLRMTLDTDGRLVLYGGDPCKALCAVAELGLIGTFLY